MILHSQIITREKFIVEDGFHPLDALLILISGSYRCTINGASFDAQVYEPVIFPQNVPFKRKTIGPIKCIYIQFDVLPQYAKENLIYSQQDKVRLANTAFYLEQAIIAKFSLDIIEHFVNDILILGNKNYPMDFDSVLRNCRIYLEENYAQNISLDFLAEKFCITKQGLIYKFKKVYHKTPIALLNEIRIDNSKMLLINTEYSIGEISEMCGFSNMYYFSNSFKKSVGISPQKFRMCTRL